MARWLSEDRGPVFLVCRYPEAYLEAKSLRLLPNVEIVSFDD